MKLPHVPTATPMTPAAAASAFLSSAILAINKHRSAT